MDNYEELTVQARLAKALNIKNKKFEAIQASDARRLLELLGNFERRIDDLVEPLNVEMRKEETGEPLTVGAVIASTYACDAMDVSDDVKKCIKNLAKALMRYALMERDTGVLAERLKNGKYPKYWNEPCVVKNGKYEIDGDK